jgi:hypothetical protein
MDPRPALLAVVLCLTVLANQAESLSAAARDTAARGDKPKALVERTEKPRHA